jgi:hypothetical protein
MKHKFLYLIFILASIFRRNQSSITFLLVIAVVVFFDILLYKSLPHIHFLQFLKSYLHTHPKELPIDLPEIWLSLLALVLGTLIIVISIASQSTPKLIDIYLKDSYSLSYVWFIAVGSLHDLFVDFFITTYFTASTNADYSKELQTFRFSALLNSYVMLPIALTFAIPYILYILRYTQTRNVVDKIYKDNVKRIQRLKVRTNFGLLSKNKTVSEYQFLLFEGLNQLDDLLKYVDFKEPKGDIVNKVSLLMQQYLEIKKSINPRFFKINASIRGDISFKTITEQFEEIEEKQIFYEHKTYRQFSNAYWHLIEKGEFDLASLCVFELYQCGKVAIEQEEEEVIRITMIRFNTILRFGIKHGLRENEARNIYNAVFYYGKFVESLIGYKNPSFVKQGATYLNIYLNEVYRHSLSKDAFGFLVDVFAWELKRILIRLHENKVSLDLERDILTIFLKIDNLGDIKNQAFNTNIRILQIGLALYYLRKEEQSLVNIIISDLVSDLEFMNVQQLKYSMDTVCKRIESATPTFWEDTDRGNLNLYYSEDKELARPFMERFLKQLEK